MTSRTHLGALCAAALLSLVAPAIAAPGDLDLSFGTGGKVITPISSSYDFGYSVAVLGDGKIIVAGSAAIGGTYDFAVARYNANGSLDTTFNGTGKVTTPIGSGNDNSYCVAVQGDGKIVVAGDSANGSTRDFALVRYNASGSLDASFNGTGKVVTSIGSGTGSNLCFGVALQGDGKIVAAGQAYNGSNYDFALVRYN